MASRKRKRLIPGSLIIGYCICADCGWTDNKFNWHTYFVCPLCGSTQYVKQDLWGDLVYGGINREVAEDEQEKEVAIACDTMVSIYND